MESLPTQKTNNNWKAIYDEIVNSPYKKKTEPSSNNVNRNWNFITEYLKL